MNRSIVLVIDARVRECGNCEYIRVVGNFRRCGIFNVGVYNERGDTEVYGVPRRLPECIKAEGIGKVSRL